MLADAGKIQLRSLAAIFELRLPLPMQTTRPRKIVRRKRNVLRIDTPSCREKRSFAEAEICWTNTPKAIDGKEEGDKQKEWRKEGGEKSY